MRKHGNVETAPPESPVSSLPAQNQLSSRLENPVLRGKAPATHAVPVQFPAASCVIEPTNCGDTHSFFFDVSRERSRATNADAALFKTGKLSQFEVTADPLDGD